MIDYDTFMKILYQICMLQRWYSYYLHNVYIDNCTTGMRPTQKKYTELETRLLNVCSNSAA